MGDGRIVDDTTTKLIIFDRQMIFGYTGLARLAGQPAHRWLTSALSALISNAPPSRPFDWFAEQLDVALGTTPVPRHVEKSVKRIAVVGVGFVKAVPDPKAPFEPACVCISNFRGPNGEWLPEALPKCTFAGLLLPSAKRFHLFHAGSPLTRLEQKTLTRAISRCLRQGTGGQPIVRLLIDQARAVSARTPTVGKSLLVASFPRAKIPVDLSFQVFGAPDYAEPTYLYVPEGEPDGRFFGPNIADRDFVACDPLVLSGEAAEEFDPKTWPKK